MAQPGGLGGNSAGSCRAAAIVIRIAAGTKNIPTENAPTTQPIHSTTAEMIAAFLWRTKTGMSATSTGTDTTTSTHAPLVWNMLTRYERDTVCTGPDNELLIENELSIACPVGANAATSAPISASKKAASVNRFAFTHPAYVRAGRQPFTTTTRERLRPAEQLADPVVGVEARPARAGLKLPVFRRPHTEAPRCLTDTESPALAIAPQQAAEHRHGVSVTGFPALRRVAGRFRPPIRRVSATGPGANGDGR